MYKKKYLVTGAAGFIGSALIKELIRNGHSVIGIDNLNNYYSVDLKRSRLQNIANENFVFFSTDICKKNELNTIFLNNDIDYVIHLAAQAGVRYSIENPEAYINANLVGFFNILDCCKTNKIKHLVYASSSSVYGLNNKIPFATSDSVNHPVSLYAATKKSNELMAHSYSHLYDLPTTGLRFFTVYGPWGRPDMAPFIFTKKILERKPIDINNQGDMWRDFTYIDDIVEGIIRISNKIPQGDNNWSVENGNPALSSAPYAIYNIGHGSPINLLKFINEIEKNLGIIAIKNFRCMQPGDVYQTFADVSDLFDTIGYKPSISITEGVPMFINWYKEFYL
ncbi:NAD-dependent epimerase/dehydratase family protein [Providencia sp. PROV174]|uniref:NAD-dependent epimerase/dehydratase family protein n=1 Tax=Providencia sp. PROV174 TaxID=2949877 RepID=UPI00234AEDFD|nr:NAD-dependent epimerase/dehydratase family protein [Providencia sp. PROV174]